MTELFATVLVDIADDYRVHLPSGNWANICTQDKVYIGSMTVMVGRLVFNFPEHYSAEVDSLEELLPLLKVAEMIAVEKNAQALLFSAFYSENKNIQLLPHGCRIGDIMISARMEEKDNWWFYINCMGMSFAFRHILDLRINLRASFNGALEHFME